MRVRIVDHNALNAISLADLSTYLRYRGWGEIDAFREKATIWGKDGLEILVPTRCYSDNARRMAEALGVIELSEHRSQIEILRDLYSVGFDVYRIRNKSGEASDGTLPLPFVVELHNGAHDMVLAAACSAISGRAIYPSKKPKQAEDFMERVRVGQTEHGSYVVTVLSPIPPKLHGEQLELTPVNEPYERLVSTTLSRGLSLVKQAAERSIATGDVSPFRAGVSRGISANLCDAIARISNTAGGEGVNVDISWSMNREVAHGVESSISIPEDSLPVISEASRLFKETEPELEYQLLGVIVKCQREHNEVIGRVTILDISFGVPRRIVVEMEGDQYDEAVDAHKECKTVRCTGELRRSGRGFVLLNHTRLNVLDDDVDV